MKKIILLLLFCFLPSKIYAGVLIEPILGASFLGSGDMSTDSSGDYSFSGTTLAFRLGFSSLGLRGGFYYGNTLSGSLERDASSGSFNYDVSRTDLGLFLGYEFPVMFGVYAQYFLASNLDIEESNPSVVVNGLDYQNREFKGDGFGLGVSYTGLPFINLNLEYRSYSYGSSEKDGVKNTSDKLTLGEVFASISFPVSI